MDDLSPVDSYSGGQRMGIAAGVVGIYVAELSAVFLGHFLSSALAVALKILLNLKVRDLLPLYSASIEGRAEKGRSSFWGRPQRLWLGQHTEEQEQEEGNGTTDNSEYIENTVFLDDSRAAEGGRGDVYMLQTYGYRRHRFLSPAFVRRRRLTHHEG